MRGRSNPRLFADLAAILAKYDPNELRDALSDLSDPSKLNSLTRLVERALAEGIHCGISRSRKDLTQTRLSDEQRIALIKESRPTDTALIDEVIAVAKAKWSKARTERLRELTGRHKQPSVTGKTVAQRRSQLVSLIENAPRILLEEIADEFRSPTQESGSLQEWSAIILRDRKPKPEST